MNKKILSVILTLAMIVTMFTGCGSKNSTYFKEIKEMSKITTGTTTVEVSCTYSGEETYDILKDKDGNQTFKIKYDVINESDKKVGAKISLQLGQEDYSELTTFVVDEKTVYITVDPIVDTIKKIDAEMATQVETALTQMGISGSISINVEQFVKALGTEIPEQSADNKNAAIDFLKTVIDIVEKDFEVLQGQDGDDYTLSLNGDNADKAVDAVLKFLENDAEKVIDEYDKLMDAAYGADNEMAKQFKEATAEMKAGIPDAVKELKDSKDEVVKEIKDSKINIVSKAKNDGKVGTLSLETGDIVSSDGEKVNLSISTEIKEGKPSIKDMIPENASDVTTMLVAMLNQMGGMGAIGGADGPTDIELQ